MAAPVCQPGPAAWATGGSEPPEETTDDDRSGRQGARREGVHVQRKGPEGTTSAAVLGPGKVALFAVPGAFTPTCSDHHLPGFVMRAEDLKAKGVDRIVCISVNDPFVMGAWGQDQNVGSSVVMLADGNGEFTEAMGLTMDGSGFGLGPLAPSATPPSSRTAS